LGTGGPGTGGAAEPEQNAPYFLRLSGRAGAVITHAEFLDGNNRDGEPIQWFAAGALELGKETTGSQVWERIYKYPSYGIGFYAAHFMNGAELGSPLALYGFFTSPIVRKTKNTFNYELALGFAFNWNQYDFETNPFNTAVSTPLTVYIDLGLDYRRALGPRWDLEVGLNLTHFSNGSLRQPNDGLNLISPKLAVEYRLTPERPRLDTSPIPPHQPAWEPFFSLAVGSKGLRHEFRNGEGELLAVVETNHDIYNLSLGLQREIAYTHKVGGGMDITYDGSLGVRVGVEEGQVIIKEGPASDKYCLGAYFSWEFVFHRASIVLQPGVYLVRQEFTGNRDWFYQKAGVKYHIGRYLFAGLTVRTLNFDFSADFIEWALGARFR
jgi:hypothetical protein